MASSTNALPIVSLCLAGLSLGAAAYQSYSHGRNLEVVQRNVLRAEYLRTCRDIIDAYFQIKMRTYAMNEAAINHGRGPEVVDPLVQREVEAAVFKFGALGTFLANFRDDIVRERYTQLSWKLLAIARETYKQPRVDFDKAYGEADTLFGEMNEDCARTARLSFF
ncbi:hypothetical protein [Phreatobacter stygius]|uniref:Uncharacterized protein n=1 Tax=Phreatobacter stygius TaxID=1940610 RepID=A0A4D7BBU3_9HYPH|nr:hypothetical protein [Phreatobacter stygius]QCI68220.1 hypothetical protein E8M01_30740 [Phreatobacter stygius]